MTPGGPLRAAANLAGRRGRVLLHSGRDDDGCGRWSFVACEPELTVEARGRRVRVRDASGAIARELEGDPLQVLQQQLEARAGAGDDADPVPIAIGYLGYDLGRTIERLPPGPARGDDVPDLWFGFYAAVARWDGAAEARARDPEIVGPDPAAGARLAALLQTDRPLGEPPRLGALVPDQDAGEYGRSVGRVRAYIEAGDVYQVNLARRLTAPIERDGDALGLYAALLARSPAPFGALIEADGVTVISGSPELFLRRAPGAARLETRPIKGTRRRDRSDAARDRALAEELGADPKELAEHLMIVDLERNDLGRIAEIGSVRVEALGYALALPTVHHLVSTVSCRVRPTATVADILRATFPGGSITGAPKIRAMQIIDELEPARRGPYTGAIGYLGAAGAIDLSIAIRAAVLAGGELRLHVGGGIVADSTAERELAETEEKAAAWRAALTR
ncbi:MAG TPA: anthranilate synthase component I family protein [Kofleriaceae bacterium]|nr:anthranilate synthase component I family protein [Kofleriaceae bacterium]